MDPPERTFLRDVRAMLEIGFGSRPRPPELALSSPSDERNTAVQYTSDPVKIAAIRYNRLLDQLTATRPWDPERSLLRQVTDLAARDLTEAIANANEPNSGLTQFHEKRVLRSVK
ncbi:MAG TPA: hypothetical protein VMK12_15825 [Anaeromyxobacteraceae bacterium]|nr:hypothetical protein [Anaeromyxobacteraceae bacterium]